MFQDFALFPHRSVGRNIAFGPRMQGLGRQEIERRVAEVLELVGLDGYQDRTIFELSGGERQRVALARALAPRPRLLLLDEPLGALDRTLRERLTGELRAIIKRAGITGVYVTHDQVEAFAVADRIVLMNAGEIVQSGQPADVYRHPATPFAARFLGLNNLIEGTIVDAPAAAGTATVVAQTALGALSLVADRRLEAGARILLLIRPEAAEPAGAFPFNHICGAIVQRAFRGGTERIVLRHASSVELELDVEADSLPSEGTVELALRPNALTIVDG
jgi:ABC-type Fe3+/spermidine/putrescine transport system ATPase subunit